MNTATSVRIPTKANVLAVEQLVFHQRVNSPPVRVVLYWLAIVHKSRWLQLMPPIEPFDTGFQSMAAVPLALAFGLKTLSWWNGKSGRTNSFLLQFGAL